MGTFPKGIINAADVLNICGLWGNPETMLARAVHQDKVSIEDANLITDNIRDLAADYYDKYDEPPSTDTLCRWLVQQLLKYEVSVTDELPTDRRGDAILVRLLELHEVEFWSVPGTIESKVTIRGPWTVAKVAAVWALNDDGMWHLGAAR